MILLYNSKCKLDAYNFSVIGNC